MFTKYQIASGDVIFFDIKDISWMEYKAGIIHFRDGSCVNAGTTLVNQLWQSWPITNTLTPTSQSPTT